MPVSGEGLKTATKSSESGVSGAKISLLVKIAGDLGEMFSLETKTENALTRGYWAS